MDVAGRWAGPQPVAQVGGSALRVLPVLQQCGRCLEKSDKDMHTVGHTCCLASGSPTEGHGELCVAPRHRAWPTANSRVRFCASQKLLTGAAKLPASTEEVLFALLITAESGLLDLGQPAFTQHVFAFHPDFRKYQHRILFFYAGQNSYQSFLYCLSAHNTPLNAYALW